MPSVIQTEKEKSLPETKRITRARLCSMILLLLSDEVLIIVCHN